VGSPPISTSADEIVAQGDVHQQIRLLRHADVEDFEICASIALTREHHLEVGGETCVVINALERPQYIVVHAVPIPSMVKAAVDVVSATLTTHEVFFALLMCGRSEDRVVGDPKY
jgi:hypothetical protein